LTSITSSPKEYDIIPQFVLKGAEMMGSDPASTLHPIPQEDWLFMNDLTQRSHWIFAKTIPESPHFYMLRKECNDADFQRFILLIRQYGVPEIYKGDSYTVLNVGDWTYWTMGAPLPETILINRKRA
jgi:hypothetical protein